MLTRSLKFARKVTIKHGKMHEDYEGRYTMCSRTRERLKKGLPAGCWQVGRTMIRKPGKILKHISRAQK